MKEERPGYDWVQTQTGGFWVKKSGARHNHSHPIFCPNCEKLSGTIDNKYFEEYGCCQECYIMNVENRVNPLIDVEMLKNRLKERGF